MNKGTIAIVLVVVLGIVVYFMMPGEPSESPEAAEPATTSSQ